MIDNPNHTLIFGGITMVDEGANPPDASGVRYNVMSQETNFGNPAPVTVALLSLMRAGSLMSYERTDNRQPVLRVTIVADDSDLLAQGEKALQLECEKSNILTWIPPDGAGEPSVFEIVWSELELVFDDVQELLQQRVYLVRLHALPYARSQNLVTTTAIETPGTPPVETVLFDGTSNTGWLTPAPPGPAVPPTVSAGTLVSSVGDPAQLFRNATSGGLVNLSAGGYLAVTWQTSSSLNPVYGGFRVGITQTGVPGSGTNQSQVLNTTSGAWTTTYVAIPAGMTAAGIQFLAFFGYGFTGITGTMTIDKVSRWNRLPDLGTARQKAMSLIPGGSVRTQGSIQVSHATTSLGKTIVYTHPSGTGYLPPLRPWRASSEAVTTDTSLFSGARNALGPTGTIYRIPAWALPEGRAEIWAWVRTVSGTGAKAIDWALSSYIGGSSLSYTVSQTTVNLPVLNTWYLVSLGAATMPPIKVGPAGSVEVHLHHGNADVQVDEAYLFATDEGRLTIVDCGSVPTSRLLWIDAPSADNDGAGAIYRGNVPDRSDAWHGGSTADVWQTHDFEPTGTSIFVVTQLDAETSLTHYKRFHTHVARDL